MDTDIAYESRGVRYLSIKYNISLFICGQNKSIFICRLAAPRSINMPLYQLPSFFVLPPSTSSKNKGRAVKSRKRSKRSWSLLRSEMYSESELQFPASFSQGFFNDCISTGHCSDLPISDEGFISRFDVGVEDAWINLVSFLPG